MRKDERHWKYQTGSVSERETRRWLKRDIDRKPKQRGKCGLEFNFKFAFRLAVRIGLAK